MLSLYSITDRSYIVSGLRETLWVDAVALENSQHPNDSWFHSSFLMNKSMDESEEGQGCN